MSVQVAAVTIVEVGPRDGLQNEATAVTTEHKIEFVNRLSASGLPVIEAGAFVSPRWVPQMADAERVFAGIDRRDGVRYAALVPNRAGLERAHAAGVREIGVFAAASETFSRKKITHDLSAGLFARAGTRHPRSRLHIHGIRVSVRGRCRSGPRRGCL
jgi:hydroxymethylglutaryl-CoA lyase